jgi:glycosyltransferase involved in cell wall biosynthesis
MPRLSVLMPARNAEATVGHAVRSCLHSMPRDAELVAWDDASTDGTVQAVERVGDRRVRIVRSEAALGPGGAMRELCRRTDSELVARMDADDISLPWRFIAQQATLARTGWDVLFTPVVRFRSAPLRVRLSAPVVIPPRMVPFHLAVMSVLMQPTMLARRSALDAAGGYRDVRAEDYDLWLRACTIGVRIGRASLPALAYRRHEGQVSFAPSFVSAQATPMFVDAYREFAHQVLGVETVWTAGAPVETAEQRRSLHDIRRVLEREANRAGAVQGRLLRRTLRHLPSAG